MAGRSHKVPPNCSTSILRPGLPGGSLPRSSGLVLTLPLHLNQHPSEHRGLGSRVLAVVAGCCPEPLASPQPSSQLAQRCCEPCSKPQGPGCAFTPSAQSRTQPHSSAKGSSSGLTSALQILPPEGERLESGAGSSPARRPERLLEGEGEWGLGPVRSCVWCHRWARQLSWGAGDFTICGA